MSEPLAPEISSMSMSSVADFPANRFPRLLEDDDTARLMLVASGRRCAALSQNSDRVGCWLRTLLNSTEVNSTRWWLTWKPLTTKSRRHLKFRLAPSDWITGGRASGFAATPTATANQGAPSMQKHPGCRGLEMTPRAWERRMGYPDGWTDIA